jgi:hypothetical protein
LHARNFALHALAKLSAQISATVFPLTTSRIFGLLSAHFVKQSIQVAFAHIARLYGCAQTPAFGVNTQNHDLKGIANGNDIFGALDPFG